MDVDEMKQLVQSVLSPNPSNTLDQYHNTGYAQKIARTPLFENASLCVVAANAVYMAVDIDWNPAPTIAEADLHFQIIEHIFCVIFVLDIAIRFAAFAVKRNALKDSWFLIDLAMTLFMVVDDWIITIWLSASKGTSTNPLKDVVVLRIFRLARLARMVRVFRFVPEVMVLIKGLTAALRSVGCVILLLVIVNYIFGLAMRQMTDGLDVGRRYFPTVLRSMYTLVIYGTFLDNLGLVTDALVAETPAAFAIFMTYICVALLTVLNILVGVLCEVVSSTSSAEKEETLVTVFREKLRRAFSLQDSSHDMMITKAQFIRVMQQPDAIRTLHEVGVDPSGLLNIVAYLYNRENYEDQKSPEAEDVRLSFDDVVEVILKLRGSNMATVKDIVDLRKFVFDSLSSLKVALVGAQAAQANLKCERRDLFMRSWETSSLDP